jgi:dihydrofolate reductase
MSKVVLELSISLDGFATGPDVSREEPMGTGGEALHEWMFAGKSEAESEAFETAHHREHGALIMGRRMVDLGIGPWGEDPPFHAPCFVVTRRPAETIVKKGGTSYLFVTDGIEAALERARQAAGSKDIQVKRRSGYCAAVPQSWAARRDPPAPRPYHPGGGRPPVRRRGRRRSARPAGSAERAWGHAPGVRRRTPDRGPVAIDGAASLHPNGRRNQPATNGLNIHAGATRSSTRRLPPRPAGERQKAFVGPSSGACSGVCIERVGRATSHA